MGLPNRNVATPVREKWKDDLVAKGLVVLDRDKRRFSDIMEEKANKLGKSWKEPGKKIKLVSRPKKKRKRIKKNANSSDEEDEKEDDDKEEKESPTKGGRKDIRKMIKEKKLSKGTREAAEEERERRKRMDERQALYNEM